jgi:glycerol-3-phosphate dehydrogenase
MERKIHGTKGVYYCGGWTDIEDLGKEWSPPSACSGETGRPSPPPLLGDAYDCDVLIIGAGCVGGSVARELSRYNLRTVLVDSSDDVTQGATKGNSGIVHAGFDDVPGTTRAAMCWKGNQMFTQLDRELRFGLQRNGSLVVARNKEECETLKELLKRGLTNGVQNLRIVKKKELREMEPMIAEDALEALYSPDACVGAPSLYFSSLSRCSPLAPPPLVNLLSARAPLGL